MKKLERLQFVLDETLSTVETSNPSSATRYRKQTMLLFTFAATSVLALTF